MSRSARVTSIDVLPLLAAALQKFRSEGAGAVDDLESEVRRALEWIHHDRKEYWAQELRRAEEALNQASLQLQQAMIDAPRRRPRRRRASTRSGPWNARNAGWKRPSGRSRPSATGQSRSTGPPTISAGAAPNSPPGSTSIFRGRSPR